MKIVKVQPSCHGEMLPWIRREERRERTERRVGEADRDDGWTTRTFKALKNRQSPATSLYASPASALGRMADSPGKNDTTCRRSHAALSDLRRLAGGRGCKVRARPSLHPIAGEAALDSMPEIMEVQPPPWEEWQAHHPGKNDAYRRSQTALSDLRRLGGGRGSEVAAAQLLRPVSARPPWVECQRKRRSPAPTLGRTK